MDVAHTFAVGTIEQAIQLPARPDGAAHNADAIFEVTASAYFQNGIINLTDNILAQYFTICF